MCHDLVVKGVSVLHPFEALGAWEAPLLRQSDGSIEGNPEHDFRVDEILLPATYLPDGHVGVLPHGADIAKYGANAEPLVVGDWFAMFVVEIDGIHQLSIDVKLNMECSAIADSNRFRVFVSAEMIKLHLW